MGPLAMAAAPHLINLFAPAAQNILQPTSTAMGNLLSAPISAATCAFNKCANKILGNSSPAQPFTFQSQQNMGNFNLPKQNQNYSF